MVEEHGFVAMGAGAEQITTHLREHWDAGAGRGGAPCAWPWPRCPRPPCPDGAARAVVPESLEVATLVRGRPRRSFRRPDVDEVRAALEAQPDQASPADEEAPPA